jgi:hypothetical protein
MSREKNAKAKTTRSEQECQTAGLPITFAQMPQHFFIVPSELLRLPVLVPAPTVELTSASSCKTGKAEGGRGGKRTSSPQFLRKKQGQKSPALPHQDVKLMRGQHARLKTQPNESNTHQSSNLRSPAPAFEAAV